MRTAHSVNGATSLQMKDFACYSRAQNIVAMIRSLLSLMV